MSCVEVCILNCHLSTIPEFSDPGYSHVNTFIEVTETSLRIKNIQWNELKRSK